MRSTRFFVSLGLLGLAACGGSAFELAPTDSQAVTGAGQGAGATVCAVALDDGGTRDYPACVGVGSIYTTVSWHTGHFCDVIDLADGGTSWQKDTNYVPCAVAQPCTVSDQSLAPTVDMVQPDSGPTRTLFFGTCR